MNNNPLLSKAGLPAFALIRPAHVEEAVLATLAANRAELEQLLAEVGDSLPPLTTRSCPWSNWGNDCIGCGLRWPISRQSPTPRRCGPPTTPACRQFPDTPRN